MHKPAKSRELNRKSYIFPKRKASSVPSLPQEYFRAGLIALHPASGLLVGAAFGYFLGKQMDAMWCFPVFLVVGLGVGCLNAYRDIRSLIRGEMKGHEGNKPPYS